VWRLRENAGVELNFADVVSNFLDLANAVGPVIAVQATDVNSRFDGCGLTIEAGRAGRD
jgi:hypothetical protein